MKKMKMKLEFSKLVIAGVMITYFITTLVGLYVIVRIDCSQLGVIATMVGTQTTSALAFYLYKAKCENELKIKNSYKGDDN